MRPAANVAEPARCGVEPAELARLPRTSGCNNLVTTQTALALSVFYRPAYNVDMKLNKEYLQSAIFGINDALVSTTGVIVGVSAGTGNKSVIILAGVVTILVEALSMGSGQYLSLKSAQQYEKAHNQKEAIVSGVIMYFGYVVGGLVPLIPILLLPVDQSRIAAIVGALIGLFVLGYVKGKIVKVSPLRSAIEIFIIGGIATLIGLVVGSLLNVNL